MNDRDIRRGDIFYIKNDDNAVGFEQKKTRPAIIVSNNANNRASGVVEIVYLTTSQKQRPLPTHIRVRGYVPSIALCEQVVTVDVSRLMERIGCCSYDEMEAVNCGLAVSLGLKSVNSYSYQQVRSEKPWLFAK